MCPQNDNLPNQYFLSCHYFHPEKYIFFAYLLIINIKFKEKEFYKNMNKDEYIKIRISKKDKERLKNLK